MDDLGTGELERLLVIMREMHDMARKGNWQVLTRLDNERRTLLQYGTTEGTATGHTSPTTSHCATTHCVASDGHDNSSGVNAHHRKLIREIRVLDEQIISTAKEARAKLLDANRELSAQVKAKNLYAQTDSMS